MSYKIYVETDESFRICTGEFDSFELANSQMKKMIVDLLSGLKNRNNFDFYFEQILNKFPDEIVEVINSYKKTGSASIPKNINDGTDDEYYYVIHGNTFEINAIIDGEFLVHYIITNTLEMDGTMNNYYFRFWFQGETLTIIMEKE